MAVEMVVYCQKHEGAGHICYCVVMHNEILFDT